MLAYKPNQRLTVSLDHVCMSFIAEAYKTLYDTCAYCATAFNSYCRGKCVMHRCVRSEARIRRHDPVVRSISVLVLERVDSASSRKHGSQQSACSQMSFAGQTQAVVFGHSAVDPQHSVSNYSKRVSEPRILLDFVMWALREGLQCFSSQEMYTLKSS